MFVRRVFYNLTDGAVLYAYSAECNVEDESLFMRIEDAVPNHDPATVGVMEWTEPDTDLEAKLNGDYDISVDVSVDPHELIFTEIVAPEPSDDDEITDSEALKIITEGETE